jgi:hypothetical protein
MRYYILILLTFLLTSCGSMYQLSTLNHTPEYIGDVRVDVIESRMDLNWKLRTDRKFRWDFAQYAMNQPLSWYYDNSWELGLYRTNFSAFDFYWNRSEIWWNWSFGYPYDWGWNRWNRWPYFNYGWSYWNDPFRFGNGWAWGYNPHRWNYPRYWNDRYRFNDFNRRNDIAYVNGRRGSSVVVTPNGSSRGNGNSIIANPNIRINNGRGNGVVRNYNVKPTPDDVDVVIEKPNKNFIGRFIDKLENNGVRVRTYENPNNIPNNRIRDYQRPNNNNNVIRNNNNNVRNYYTPPNNNNNIRSSSPPVRSSSPPVIRNNSGRSSGGVSISRGSRGNNID